MLWGGGVIFHITLDMYTSWAPNCKIILKHIRIFFYLMSIEDGMRLTVDALVVLPAIGCRLLVNRKDHVLTDVVPAG